MILLNLILNHPEVVAVMLIGPPPNRPQGYWGMIQAPAQPTPTVVVGGSTLPMMGVG